MLAYVITLKGDEYSERVASRCIQSAEEHSLVVSNFYGVDRKQARSVMVEHNLEWSWANNNTKARTCPTTGLYQFPYTAADTTLADLDSKIGCSMSHYLLWKYCIERNEPLLILEHDAVFLKPLPEINFKGICQINDPAGATPKGNWWSQQMRKRGPGVFEKTWIRPKKERHIPDGLAGHSAYMIKPWAAQKAIDKYHELGVWPNDAMICKQLFPCLEEYYPFITKVVQAKSTSTTSS